MGPAALNGPSLRTLQHDTNACILYVGQAMWTKLWGRHRFEFPGSALRVDVPYASQQSRSGFILGTGSESHERVSEDEEGRGRCSQRRPCCIH